MAEPRDTTAVDAPPVPRGRAARRRRLRWPVALLLVWGALAVADIILFGSSPGAPPAAANRPAATPSAHAGGRTHPASARTSAPRRAHSRVLVPVSAVAFGPSGPGSGDNAQNAYRAIDASTATAWLTDWYRSAQFGSLQAGTGLLLDMGRRVRITRARILLGSAQGANLELLTGNVAELGRMREQASAGDAAGAVRLRLASPRRARYLLIWFTLLPPDSAGTFRAAVYDVTLRGTA